jgi:peptidoglycan/xylan/chitin deacetylase (PgdA/CDA1 family)
MTTTLHARWHLKKLARKGCALASQVSSQTSTCKLDVRALTTGSARPDATFSVQPDDFASRWVAGAARDRRVAARRGRLIGGRRPSLVDGAVLVTIDDGCRPTAALPLRRYGIPAVAFVPAGELLTDAPHTAAANAGEAPDARMTWNDLEAMVRGGMTVGSHGWPHRSLGRMPLDSARDHAARSREAIERHIGQPVTAFAYPFGTRADFSSATGELLREVGYACAFTSQHGTITPHSRPFELPRVKVEGGEPLWLFRLLIQGGLDRWEWVDRMLWRFQAAGA